MTSTRPASGCRRPRAHAALEHPVHQLLEPEHHAAGERARPDYITVNEAAQMGWTADEWRAWQAQYIQDNLADFQDYHEQVLSAVNQLNTTFLDPRLPGGHRTLRGEVREITGKRFTEGGSLFFDRSALAHVMGEKRFQVAPRDSSGSGADRGRWQLPHVPAQHGGHHLPGHGRRDHRNEEFGLYTGVEKWLLDRRLKATVTLGGWTRTRTSTRSSVRRLAGVEPHPGTHLRVSFSSAIRNPTLADQYLYYNGARPAGATWTASSRRAGTACSPWSPSTTTGRTWTRTSSTTSTWTGSGPEQVRTIEAGYWGTHGNGSMWMPART